MDIVQKAENYVFQLFKDKLSGDYIYHNFNHTLRVVNGVKIISAAEKVSAEDIEVLLLAAWFHDTGYIKGPEEHELASTKIASEFLDNNGYSGEKAEKVADLIKATQLCREPETLNEKIIRDADCSHFADENYISLSELLREEWQITLEKTYSDQEWAKENIKVLAGYHRFYTNYGKEKLQPLKEQNILLLQEKMHEPKKGKKKDKDTINKKKLEKLDRPERGIDTMFRITLNNHTRLSEIADSKANILLSVNAVIISIALTTLIPKLDSPSNAHLVMPTMILMAFCVVTINFAIMSTRPKVTGGTFTRKDIEDKKVNLLFFGNFYKMPLDEYQWAVNEMMKDRDYLYNSMIKDLYFLGLVLNRKYRLLRITYTLFTIGILVSVFAFVYAFMSI